MFQTFYMLHFVKGVQYDLVKTIKSVLRAFLVLTSSFVQTTMIVLTSRNTKTVVDSKNYILIQENVFLVQQNTLLNHQRLDCKLCMMTSKFDYLAIFDRNVSQLPKFLLYMHINQLLCITTRFITFTAIYVKRTCIIQCCFYVCEIHSGTIFYLYIFLSACICLLKRMSLHL